MTEAVRYEVEDGIAHLVLDDPNQSANTMNQAYSESMAAAATSRSPTSRATPTPSRASSSPRRRRPSSPVET
jgi:3-hydroxyacyl-CoA dehydrogenase/enoyl-CoA hydratase/3-hydroxybutyryl-CoA epimerase